MKLLHLAPDLRCPLLSWRLWAPQLQRLMFGVRFIAVDTTLSPMMILDTYVSSWAC